MARGLLPVWQTNQNMDREIPEEERKKIVRTKIIRGSVVALVIIIALMFFIHYMSGSIRRSEVILSTVDRGRIELSYAASGVVSPAFEEIINSPIDSRILEVYHKNGDAVDEGTPLLKLDLQQTQNNLSTAEDQLAMKRSELSQLKLNNQTELNDLAMKVKVSRMEVKRMEVELRNEQYLDSLGSGTTDNVREAEMNLKKGELQLQQLQQQYENEKLVKSASVQSKELEMNILAKSLQSIRQTFTDAQIRSPRKAILSYINNQIGVQVTQGSKVAVVSDLSHFKVNCEIADSYGGQVAAGGKAMVRIGSKQLEGTITNVTPQSQNGVINFIVEMKQDNDAALRSGLKVDVYVMSSIRDNTLRLANGSYYSNNAGTYELFVLEGGTLVRRKVELGDCSFEYVEVKSGLKEGDQVVVSDMSNYKNKNKLRIK